METAKIVLIILAVIVIIISVPVAIWRRRRAQKMDQDPANIENDKKVEEKYASLCESNERLIVVCRGYYKDEYYILTDERLFIENKKGVHTIPLGTVKKIEFLTVTGGKTKYTSECFTVMVYANKRYWLYRNSEKFDEICAYFSTWL